VAHNPVRLAEELTVGKANQAIDLREKKMRRQLTFGIEKSIHENDYDSRTYKFPYTWVDLDDGSPSWKQQQPSTGNMIVDAISVHDGWQHAGGREKFSEREIVKILFAWGLKKLRQSYKDGSVTAKDTFVITRKTPLNVDQYNLDRIPELNGHVEIIELGRVAIGYSGIR
jgi:hypothetical protein